MAGSDGRALGRTARVLRLAVGFALIQGAWLACVIGAARGQAALGIAAAVGVLAVLLVASRERGAQLRLIALALAIGVVWDSLLARTGVVVYASPGPLPGWAPAWILALWALFAPMLSDPLRWLQGRPALAALCGGIGGALSYAAAERLGACRLPDPILAMAVLGAGWSLIVPLLLAAARWLESVAPLPAAPASGEAPA